SPGDSERPSLVLRFGLDVSFASVGQDELGESNRDAPVTVGGGTPDESRADDDPALARARSRNDRRRPTGEIDWRKQRGSEGCTRRRERLRALVSPGEGTRVF